MNAQSKMNDVAFFFSIFHISKRLCSMAWMCSVCQAGEPAEVSYASVLVFGTQDMQEVEVRAREECSGPPVANATSYCLPCRRVTATFTAQLSTTANLIVTHKLRLEYAQHQLFQESLPEKRQFRKLLRKTSRKHGCSMKPSL
jgi:hypothetical protein